ncbi:hypothetical protein BDV18DRAFT_157883 [Aspergillus unguis]
MAPSDDPKCLCYPRPEKPFQKLELTIRGPKPEDFCRLDQPGAQLDVIFDLIGNGMTLREAIGDPNRPKTAYTISLLLKSEMWVFTNLKGLADNSLLLNFQLKSSTCAAVGKDKMLYTEKYQGFSPDRLESKLYNHVYSCNWSEQHLELLLPAERIMGWKTAALILKTFKRITPENWCHMVVLRNRPGVAGMDWMAIEAQAMPTKIEEPVALGQSAEEKKLHYFIEKKKKKKAAAMRTYLQKQALLAQC